MRLLEWWKASRTRKLPELRAGSRRMRLETLETRCLLSATVPGMAVPTYTHFASAPYASSGPTGYTPAQMRAAYGFSNSNISSLTGAGTTIAIVDAYDDPTIASDLQTFDKQFGLANPTFTKENQNGSDVEFPHGEFELGP